MRVRQESEEPAARTERDSLPTRRIGRFDYLVRKTVGWKACLDKRQCLSQPINSL